MGVFFWPVDKPLHPWRVRIGVDFGGNGSKHAFVATAILPGYSGVVGLASQRIDPVAQDADFLADRLLEFCMAVFARWGEIQYIFCDSAEQTLINHIRARLRRCKLSWLADRVENSAKIRINDRIRLTCILMGGGRFWLLPEASTSGMPLPRPCTAASTPAWTSGWMTAAPISTHWTLTSTPSSAISRG